MTRIYGQEELAPAIAADAGLGGNRARTQDEMDGILILGLDYTGAFLSVEEHYHAREGGPEGRNEGVRRAFRDEAGALVVEYSDLATRRTEVDNPELLQRGIASRTVIELNPKRTIDARTDGWRAKGLRTSFRSTEYTNGSTIDEVVFTDRDGQTTNFVVPPVDSNRDNPIPLAVRRDPENRPFELEAVVPEHPAYKPAWALYNGLASLLKAELRIDNPITAVVRARQAAAAEAAQAAPVAVIAPAAGATAIHQAAA